MRVASPPLHTRFGRTATSPQHSLAVVVHCLLPLSPWPRSVSRQHICRVTNPVDRISEAQKSTKASLDTLRYYQTFFLSFFPIFSSLRSPNLAIFLAAFFAAVDDI